jgi:hypothetical protein
MPRCPLAKGEHFGPASRRSGGQALHEIGPVHGDLAGSIDRYGKDCFAAPIASEGGSHVVIVCPCEHESEVRKIAFLLCIPHERMVENDEIITLRKVSDRLKLESR